MARSCAVPDRQIPDRGRILVATADRISTHPLAERLQQHAVEAQLGAVAKLLDADGHRIVAGRRLRTVRIEHAHGWRAVLSPKLFWRRASRNRFSAANADTAA
jgi:hypothetical protein